MHVAIPITIHVTISIRMDITKTITTFTAISMTIPTVTTITMYVAITVRIHVAITIRIHVTKKINTFTAIAITTTKSLLCNWYTHRKLSQELFFFFPAATLFVVYGTKKKHDKLPLSNLHVVSGCYASFTITQQ